MDTDTPHSAALYLRTDGTLMLARGDETVEMHLSVAQLLQLGVDALRVAVELQPACIDEALQALERTTVQVPVTDEGARPCIN
jgi:hypothetical protein